MQWQVQPTQEAQGLLQLTTVGPCAWGVQQVGQGAFQFFLPLPWHTAWSEHSQALQATLAWHRRSRGADVPVSLALHGCSLAPLALQAHLLGAVHILVACASDCQRREMAGMFALFAASFASPTPGTPGAAPGPLPRTRDILVLQYQQGVDVVDTLSQGHERGVLLLGLPPSQAARVRGGSPPPCASLLALPSDGGAQAMLCIRDVPQLHMPAHVSHIVARGREVVVKVVPQQYADMGAWAREVWWLQRTAAEPWTPPLLSADASDRSIVMAWAGHPLNASNLPADWHAQGARLDAALAAAGCTHNDWHVGNLVVGDGGALTVLDFSWAAHGNDSTCGGLCPPAAAKPYAATPATSFLQALQDWVSNTRPPHGAHGA